MTRKTTSRVPIKESEREIETEEWLFQKYSMGRRYVGDPPYLMRDCVD